MNSIFIVLPILTILMFDLGLTLRPQDFVLLFHRPKAVILGLLGQMLLLPLVACIIGIAFSLPPIFFIGIMLIGCCPGGSSSNIFSKLAKGDVALSVSLTAMSSVLTLFTIPLIMQWATTYVSSSVDIKLPVMNLLMQNLLTMLLPIILGIVVRIRWKNVADKLDKILSKVAFPALMIVAGTFFIQEYDVICDNFTLLGLCVLTLLIIITCLAGGISRLSGLSRQERRTIIIEVGMQNAAQAIAIATSEYVFNNKQIAIPAIIYSLLMNVVLLTYVGFIKKQ